MSARILVVEDEEALTTLLRYNLEAEGYEVETVARGDDADTRLKERLPDLIVLDWMLPGLSGIELCRRLRARPETKQLPIIMLTRSLSSPRAVSMMIGSCFVSGLARKRRHSSMPDSPGSIQSSTIRSGRRSFSRVSASSPRVTVSTS